MSGNKRLGNKRLYAVQNTYGVKSLVVTIFMIKMEQVFEFTPIKIQNMIGTNKSSARG